jgi:hypothetical protein
MGGAVPPLPQYAFMAWCSVRESTGQLYLYLYLYLYHRAGSLKTVASELAEYKLELVAVQDIRWGKGGSRLADEYTLFYGIGNANHCLGVDVFVHKGIRSAVKRAEIVSDRMSYVTLRDH